MPPSALYIPSSISDEIYPSTRESLHIYNKSRPADVTLTTAGTAQNLISISRNVPTINLCTNPSMETGTPPTGYTASGATLAQSATVARSGTNSLRITPDNAAAGEGAYWSTITLGLGGGDLPPNLGNINLVVSAYFNDNAGSGNGVRVVIANSSGTTLVNGNTVTLAADWLGRSQAFLPLAGRANQSYRIYFVTATQFATVFYVDDFQYELQLSNGATAYCDGAVGLYNSWDGTAHASTSRRLQTLVAIRGYRLYTTGDIYFAEDHTASSTTGEFIRAGTDFEASGLHISNNLSFVNVNAGETPRVYGRVYGVHVGNFER